MLCIEYIPVMREYLTSFDEKYRRGPEVIIRVYFNKITGTFFFPKTDPNVDVFGIKEPIDCVETFNPLFDRSRKYITTHQFRERCNYDEYCFLEGHPFVTMGIEGAYIYTSLCKTDVIGSYRLYRSHLNKLECQLMTFERIVTSSEICKMLTVSICLYKNYAYINALDESIKCCTGVTSPEELDKYVQRMYPHMKKPPEDELTKILKQGKEI